MLIIDDDGEPIRNFGKTIVSFYVFIVSFSTFVSNVRPAAAVNRTALCSGPAYAADHGRNYSKNARRKTVL